MVSTFVAWCMAMVGFVCGGLWGVVLGVFSFSAWMKRHGYVVTKDLPTNTKMRVPITEHEIRTREFRKP